MSDMDNMLSGLDLTQMMKGAEGSLMEQAAILTELRLAAAAGLAETDRPAWLDVCERYALVSIRALGEATASFFDSAPTSADGEGPSFEQVMAELLKG